ncbi:cytochrome P450 6a2 [Tribolium castaneum]|uniref:Cytochrome P450 6BR1 n=1 Tax=Tribolium castaneum TaxID=7070 RepID=D7EJ99_TRICA|nr:PREDICTED: cytochrome P450 6a2 [Tribolium castaneum]EFA12629.1 cytochrome P450 6BR1 [Tribolium castaneum]|eukprot:XP_969875.1 PREDICTED: cytochrome P450 6a2 [Tribolium castaneum]
MNIPSPYFEILGTVLALLVAIIFYYHHAFQFWARKNIPFIPPRFPLGNTNVVLPRGLTIGLLSKTFYDYFKQRGHKIGGVFLVTEPNLMILDPDYIKNILLKDFHHFVDRGFYFNEKTDPISANLFTIDGDQWRNLRTKLTPTFTSSKMKIMFQTVKNCCNNMLEAIASNTDLDKDLKEFLGRYTVDVVGSCAFGIECNSFKHPDAEFRKMGLRAFHFSFLRSIRAFFIAYLPKLSRQMGLPSNNKDIREFFYKVVMETIQKREETQIKRNDFLQILMDLRKTEILSLDEVAAQVFLFFTAGFETSSSTMAMCLYEIAKEPEYQEKLRQEICEITNGEITYENLFEMKYLDQVFSETLRKYPPGQTLNRRCVKDYTLPGTSTIIEKGTPILISAIGVHRDPEYYPDPEKFDPERFSEENKKLRHPFVYLPFGDGPRNCIGMRFGTMQSKLGIASVVKNFKVSVSPITKRVELDPNTFLLNTIDKIYFRVEKIVK